MQWVPVTDYDNDINEDDTPRKLSEAEIEYIVSHLPTPLSADPDAAEITRNGIIEWMVQTLKEVSICPSAIPELIERIVDQHNRSQVIPGTPVGINAAEAVGATTTQMTLNSVAPWEQILIQDRFGQGHIVKIGEWIDQLLLAASDKIVHIPENRTQYLELQHPVKIATTDENGKVTFETVTAITKHLPIGDLVKITTKTGREVTATQNKSLLTWNGFKLIQTAGKDVKIGDLVPIINRLPEPEIVHDKLYDIDLNYESGREFAEYFIDPKSVSVFSKFIVDNDIIPDLLFANKSFLLGVTEVVSSYCRETRSINFIKARLESTGNDIMLDPINKVEFVPATEYVYDLTVPATLNFSLYNGLLINDTFHSSGSSISASFGIDAMRDLIFARKSIKNESCTIYFTNKRATYEQILDYRRYIVGNKVNEFVKDFDIDSPNSLERYWWHDSFSLFSPTKVIPKSSKVLRLFLDIAEMYKHKVTIEHLASILEKEVPQSVIAIYGSIGDGIIDLYPNPDHIKETLQKFSKEKEKAIIPDHLSQDTYLADIVLPELSRIRVKGIADIKRLVPVVSPVWRMVFLERKINAADVAPSFTDDPASIELKNILRPELGNSWLLFYNIDVMNETGLLSGNLGALCQLAGLRIIIDTPEYLAIAMPNDRFRTSDGTTVIKVGNRKYHLLNKVDLEEFDDVLYKKLNQNDVTKVGNKYHIKLEDKHKNQGGWIETVEPQIIDEVDIDEIRSTGDAFYRRIPNDQIFNADDETYEEILDPRIRVSELKPSEYINYRVTRDTKRRDEEIKRLTNEVLTETKGLPEMYAKPIIKKRVRVNKTELMEASEFVIAQTEGSNLKKLLSLPYIDKRLTVCNNMYTISSTLGAEAAYNFICNQIHDTISNTGSYVHPTNILLIAEFIMSRGEPYGANFTGISRQPAGHLSLASLERAGKVFTQSALHSRKEDIRNVSASVSVGARMAIGNGSFDVAQTVIENGIQRTLMNEDLFNIKNEEEEPIQPVERSTLAENVEILKGIKQLGPRFDYAPGEEGGGFVDNEVIPDIIENPTIVVTHKTKLIRRVHAYNNEDQERANQENIQITSPIPSTGSNTETVPYELVDMISSIATKRGTPISRPQPITLTSEPEIVIPTETKQSIKSMGIVTLADILSQPSIQNEIPKELSDLLNDFLIEDEAEDEFVPEQIPESEEPGPEVIIQELPSIELPQLGNVGTMRLGRYGAELRREQVRNLEPIDMGNLESALTQK